MYIVRKENGPFNYEVMNVKILFCLYDLLENYNSDSFTRQKKTLSLNCWYKM